MIKRKLKQRINDFVGFMVDNRVDTAKIVPLDYQFGPGCLMVDRHNVDQFAEALKNIPEFYFTVFLVPHPEVDFNLWSKKQ